MRGVPADGAIRVKRCFVIQPFDEGKFDDRYEDVIEPAIRAAGLEPYRVDRDPSVVIPIDRIAVEIREAAICLAEISTDNPNVWFELGFAIALEKPVVLICSEREKFPFDVQHRSILPYLAGSIRDFETLRARITEKLRSLTSRPASGWPPEQPLSDDEIKVLQAVAENPESLNHDASADRICERVGPGLSVGLQEILDGLIARRIVSARLHPGQNGDALIYTATRSGLNYLNARKGLQPVARTDEDDGGPF